MIAHSRLPASGVAEVSRTTHREFADATEQLRFLYHEMSAGHPGLRGLLNFCTSWFRGGRVVVAAYRCKRFWYLLLGQRAHDVSMLWMWPIYWWCRLIGGRHEIQTPAQIGPGFRVIHCSLPCVISPYLIAGKALYLTGGNVIGRRRVGLQSGAISLGDDVELGIGSMVIGPLRIGDRVRIGAGTTVVKDVPSGTRVVGSPARQLISESLNS